ncbi:homeodomain-interacting protein kinase 2-like [Clinocottus analis]|uniref:homeodomain-interacting protein kinase 2-like n=1 Tax=Clinocottus analis TaxID=304258 RepID=UPI0035C02CEA
MFLKKKFFKAVLDEKKKSEVQNGDILYSNKSCYLIQDFIGEGSYGKVAKCVNLITSQEVALKILKTENSYDNIRELKMLKAVGALDPVKANVLQLLETFEHNGQTCLAFEMLDRSLHQLLHKPHEPLSLGEIRPVAQQLLVAFKALKEIGVVHADLKLDNIMLTDHCGEPFKVKLIDFGVSFFTFEKLRRDFIQPLGYRAPEVTLGLPVSEAIDMWGLGCVLFKMYCDKHLFAVHSTYQSMNDIVDALGQPPDHLLSAGYYTLKYFKLNQDSNRPTWRLMTQECQLRKRPFKSLDERIMLNRKIHGPIELEDQRAFVRLLKSLLHTDPEKRITPEKALQHPFITMAHLEDKRGTSSYVNKCFEKMLVCRTDESGKKHLPGNGASTKPLANGAGSSASCSFDKAGAVSAASPADRLLAEGPPEVKKNYLKRIRQFFQK